MHMLIAHVNMLILKIYICFSLINLSLANLIYWDPAGDPKIGRSKIGRKKDVFFPYSEKKEEIQI